MGVRIIHAPKWWLEGGRMPQHIRPPKPAQKDCAELGNVIPGQGKVGCGKVRRSCALHGECTTITPINGLHCCQSCPDHTGRLK